MYNATRTNDAAENVLVLLSTNFLVEFAEIGTTNGDVNKTLSRACSCVAAPSHFVAVHGAGTY